LSDINSNAEAYFGGLDIAGPVTGTAIVSSSTITGQQTMDSLFDPISSIYVDHVTSYTFTQSYNETYYQDHAGARVSSATQAGFVISLETPFVDLPLRGATGLSSEIVTCHQNGGTQSYGYIPRSLLDLLVSNPAYGSQYPGLESCLPGGPSIIKVPSCADVMPTWMESVDDLTSSTVIYVTPPILGDSPQSDESDAQSMGQKSGVDDKDDSSTSDISPPTLRSTPVSSSKMQAATDPPKPSPPISSPTPTPTSLGIPVPQTETETLSLLAASADSLSQLPTTASLGQIINSIFGGQPASPISPNSPSIVIPAATTIPIADIPFYSGVVGTTSTINGDPVVIVPLPTILAVPVQTQDEILISEATTIPVADLPFFPGLEESTKMIDGVPVIVVSDPTTLIPPSIQSLAATTADVADSLTTSDIEGNPTTNTAKGIETGEATVIRQTTVSLNPDSPVSGNTIVSSGITYVVVSSAISAKPQTPASSLLSSATVTDRITRSAQGVTISATSSKSVVAPQLRSGIWKYVMVECGVLVVFLGICGS